MGAAIPHLPINFAQRMHFLFALSLSGQVSRSVLTSKECGEETGSSTIHAGAEMGRFRSLCLFVCFIAAVTTLSSVPQTALDLPSL